MPSMYSNRRISSDTTWPFDITFVFSMFTLRSTPGGRWETLLRLLSIVSDSGMITILLTREGGWCTGH